MKVIIAVAGKGTRMLHLCKNKCKHLINVQNKPFLYYLIHNLKKAGYKDKDLIIVGGYKEESIREFLKEYKIKSVFINQFEVLGQEEYGTACPIKCVKDILKGENFISIYGDNLYSVADLKAMNIEDNFNYVAGLIHKKPEKYGILIEKNGILEKIIEKPKEFVGNLINTGLYKFTPEVFDKILKIKKSQRGEYELTDAVTALAEEGKVKVKKIKEYWIDFGNPADIMRLSKFIKTSNNFK